MNAFNQIGTFTPDNLIAGNQVPILTKAIEINTGTGILKRGSIISVDGKLAAAATTDVDGILTDDVVLDSTNKVDAAIYISGEFNSSFMAVANDTTVMNFQRKLRELGIYVK